MQCEFCMFVTPWQQADGVEQSFLGKKDSKRSFGIKINKSEKRDDNAAKCTAKAAVSQRDPDFM